MLKYIKNKEKIVATLLASGLIIQSSPISAFADDISILNKYFREQLQNDVRENVESQAIRNSINSEEYKEVLKRLQMYSRLK